MLTRIIGPIINGSPLLKRIVWKKWYEFLARGYRQDNWTFMNYGYADAQNAAIPGLTLEADDEANRWSIQLYHQVATGGGELRGKDVLEVGSGRGGGSSYIARYLQPRTMLGVDYSENAATLSQKLHAAVPGLTFQQGDAEALPCRDGAFDAVVNVESSHCYGSMERFLSEVYRVLRPGGYFLWADMRPRGERDSTRAQFQAAGLEMRNETEITPNVVRALDQIKDQKLAAIRRSVPRFLHHYFEDFAGVPGTRVYESLKAGDVQYWRCALQKPLSD